MESMHRAKNVRGEVEFPCPLWSCHFLSSNPEVLRVPSFMGFPGGSLDGMIDYVIDH